MKSSSSKKRRSAGNKRSSAAESSRSKKQRASAEEQEANEESPSYNLRQRDAIKKKKYNDDIDWDSDQPMVEGEVEVTATTPEPGSDESPSPPPPRTSPRSKEQQALLPKQLKDSLKRVKNLLKLPKARRWAYCEFFVADIDSVLVRSDEEFRHCLRESFPDLGTHFLRKAEWRQVRRLIGKPRRYSAAFLESERQELEKKRRRIRDIQKGAALTLDDEIELPPKIPKPFVVGARVFARVRFPKDGIYAGIVDAIMEGRYRVIFDKDVVMPLIIHDGELMSETPGELVPVSFFLEKNKAALPTTLHTGFLLTCEKLLASDELAPSLRNIREYVLGPGGQLISAPPPEPRSGRREERCGNYPLRMVVMLVKLSKLLEKKKSSLDELRELNCDAERSQLRTSWFPRDFQENYAHNVLDLDDINKEIDTYLMGIAEYTGLLLPHLTEVSVASRPEALQRFCHMRASQIVKASNMDAASGVESKKSLALVTSLMAVLLQIRALGQQQCTGYELDTMRDTVEQIKESLDEGNRSTFEDSVEVNVKHIELAMKGWRGIGTAAAADDREPSAGE